MNRFFTALAYAASTVEHALDTLLPKSRDFEARLFDAMRYAALGGGTGELQVHHQDGVIACQRDHAGAL